MQIKCLLPWFLNFKLCQQHIVFSKIKPQGRNKHIYIFFFKYNLEIQLQHLVWEGQVYFITTLQEKVLTVSQCVEIRGLWVTEYFMTLSHPKEILFQMSEFHWTHLYFLSHINIITNINIFDTGMHFYNKDILITIRT